VALSQPCLEDPVDAGMGSQLIAEVPATGITQEPVELGDAELAKRTDL
jgi:hypothetical protein